MGSCAHHRHHQQCNDSKHLSVDFFLNSVREWGLQPRIAPVCTGAGAGSGSTRFRRRFRRFRRRSGRLWCRARSGSTGFRRRFPEKVLGSLGAKPSQVQQDSGEGSGEAVGEALGLWCRAEVFPALGFAESFRKICKNQALRLFWGYHQSLLFHFFCDFAVVTRFAPIGFYKQTILRTETFTQNSFYA